LKLPADKIHINISEAKKVYFASDFHLGAPDFNSSKEREIKIVHWLNSIRQNAQAVFLVGDIFDFWFEYVYTVPKGFVRLQGKIAEFTDSGIPVYLFSGNHDMWMFGYLEKELGVKIYHNPIEVSINNFKLMVGHGDGLGPGDYSYKFLKKIFRNRICQWMFARLHPNLSFFVANKWSRKSRISNNENDKYLGENEWLFSYCKEVEELQHHDFYIFGHRHLPLDLKVADNSRYINLGEWMNYFTFAELSKNGLTLKSIKDEKPVPDTV
jgi:UDP-2,3-diacylglucosamine hydrolase